MSDNSQKKGGQTNFFGWVGNATTQWEAVEVYLAQLFDLLCASPHHGPFRIFGAIESKRARVEMLQIACDQFFGDEHAELAGRVKSALAKLNDLGRMRNELAHGCVNLDFETPDLELTLQPPAHNPRKFCLETGPKYTLRIADIRKYHGEFMTFCFELKHLIRDIEPLHDKRIQQYARLLHKEHQKARMLEIQEPSPPPQPSEA